MGSPSPETSREAADAPSGGDRSTVILLSLGFIALTGQLGVLLRRSVHQYRTFNLSIDFGSFFQAWHQLAHGNLSPSLSDFAVPFWRSHFELIMWLLAPLYWLNRADGRTLLFLQDLAIVASEAIAFTWVVMAARRARLPSLFSWTAGIAVLTMLIANPLLYVAAGQDFHFEAFGTCFALAAALEFWRGHKRLAWLWVALALCCGDVTGTYIAALGLGFAVSMPSRRRQGLALMLIGVGWVGLVAALGANKGSAIAGYAYLAGTATLPEGVRGVSQIVKGVVLHPTRPWRQIHSAWPTIRHNLASAGFLGAIAPLTFGVVLVVLLENALNSHSIFLKIEFQNVPVFLFATVGTVLLVIQVAQRLRRLRILGALLLIASLTSALNFDWKHRQTTHQYRVSSAIASQLDAVRSKVPDDAEVVSSHGVVGRFSGRRWVYTIAFPNRHIPIVARKVFFVIAPTAGNQPLSAGTLSAMWAIILKLPSIQPVATGPDIYAALWTPDKPTSLVVPAG
jgi:uncharacterized membrane protein